MNGSGKRPLWVVGKMSENGADKAGVILSLSLGASALISAVSLLMYVIRWW